jgi:hypothetical protein
LKPVLTANIGEGSDKSDAAVTRDKKTWLEVVSYGTGTFCNQILFGTCSGDKAVLSESDHHEKFETLDEWIKPVNFTNRSHTRSSLVGCHRCYATPKQRGAPEAGPNP